MNDAKPDVAQVEPHCSGHKHFEYDCIDCSDALERMRRGASPGDGTYTDEAALAKPASGDGLPELPTPCGPWHATSDDTGYYTYTADQMRAIRDAGIAYGRRLATPSQSDTEGVPFCPRCGAHPDEQPGSAVQGEAVARAITAVKESELFEDGVEADLASAGITTIAGAFMEGRMAAISELEMELEGQSVAATTPPPAPAADHIVDAGKKVAPAAEQGGREADRRRFPDPDFNAWLDQGISDCGHTVWDAVGDVQAAWQGWEAAILAQPEARGVEGVAAIAERLVQDWQRDGRMPAYAWDFRGFAVDAMQRYAATPNPVRAEQPEVQGAWKLVPVTPTDFMVHVGNTQWADPARRSRSTAADVYRAMLAAAPAAPGVRVDEATLRQALHAMKRCKQESPSGKSWDMPIAKLTAALATDGGKEE